MIFRSDVDLSNTDSNKENIAPNTSDTTIVRLKQWIRLWLKTGEFPPPVDVGRKEQIDAFHTESGDIFIWLNGTDALLITEAGRYFV